MNSFTKLHRRAIWTTAVLVLATIAICAMPVQAAYLAEKAATTARAATMHLCERFCGHHHHHHGHQWRNGHEDFWCPGH
ncbi:MAG: hypothetical protein U1F71_23695 [Verrucomicrobiaceae bacterium]